MFSSRIVLKLYRDIRGEIPFESWLSSLRDVRARQAVDARLLRIADGNFGDCKSLGGGVYELRVFYGQGLRIYFGKIGGQLVLLLAGGEKKNQQKDIKKAKDFWRDFKNRSSN